MAKSESSTPKPRFFSNLGDRIAFWVLIGLLVAVVIANALKSYANLQLVHGELYVYMPLLMALILVGWGLSAIFRRLRGVVKGIVGAVMVLVMLALMVLGTTYGGIAAGLLFPQRYVDVTAPDGGHRLMVMRGFDTDETRLEARRALRLEANPDSDPEIVAGDYGYTYTAYTPALMDLFFHLDTARDGEIHVGYASKAELMVEWEDDGATAHFFLKNPEPTDEGEMRVQG
ncbi:MAG: hypothetical protein ACSW8J_07765 [bacterium]